MMSLILSLIIAVAAFNIVASLVMVVTDKTNDIAILRTLGMGPNGVVQRVLCAGRRDRLGRRSGWRCARCRAGHQRARSSCRSSSKLWVSRSCLATCYYVTRIPSELEWTTSWSYAVSAFVLTSLATLYPARRAAHVNPAMALRYE